MTQLRKKNRINKIEPTNEIITGRGGLVLFCRYLEKIGILNLMGEQFKEIRKSNKGLPIPSLFKQIFCFFFDGTSRRLSFFDHLKKDEGYPAVIETDPSETASSHIIKRFFASIGWWKEQSFRWILRKLFIWRLKVTTPKTIKMYMDTMVMNNDDAQKRQGVEPTYKKVKGFHPFNIIWEGYIVDTIFRSGAANGNNGDTVVHTIKNMVELIRNKYRPDVTIILCCDAGFFDKKNFKAFNEMNIGFIASGKMYDGVKKCAGSTDPKFWGEYDNGRQIWNFLEFGFRCDSWGFFLRAVYTRLANQGRQMLLDFARPDNVIVTNIGINPKVLEFCTPQEKEYWLKTETLIARHHQNGTDELTHRGFKDFGFEQLPFKQFEQNKAFYYCMVISFFLFESFKEDVLAEVIPVTGYAATVRRKFVDFGAKVIKTGHQIILKIPYVIMESLKIERLWLRCQNPPPIPC